MIAEDGAKIEVMRDQHGVHRCCSGEYHFIWGIGLPNLRAMVGFPSLIPQQLHPTWVTGSCRAEISCSRQSDFTVFGEPCGISQSLENVFSFQIWIIGQNFFDAAARANLADDHADGYAHTANARLAVPWGPSGRWLHANSRWG